MTSLHHHRTLRGDAGSLETPVATSEGDALILLSERRCYLQLNRNWEDEVPHCDRQRFGDVGEVINSYLTFETNKIIHVEAIVAPSEIMTKANGGNPGFRPTFKWK